MRLAAQVISITGAAIILVAYALAQNGRVSPRGLAGINLAGAVLLTVSGIVERQIGVVLLESSWAIMSVYALSKGVSAKIGKRSTRS